MVGNRQLTEGLAAADLRVLVMCLYHLTGDPAWLDAPYRPARDVRLIADPAAGFEPAIQDEIRAAVAGLADTDGAFPEPAVGDPGRERFHEMLSVFLGEQVPPEYVPMIREDMGFDPADTVWPSGVPDDAAGRLDDAQDGTRGDALPASGFPHDAQRPALGDVERGAIDGLDGAFILEEIGLQVAN